METNQANLFLKKKLNELAAMFKEKGEGTFSMMTRIKARYCLQEGVKEESADEHVKILIDAGLISFFLGSRRWRYNKRAEWDLFSVTPISLRRKRR
jgi:hypothetical protein